mgnify:CR=1 FL=1
MSCVAAGCRASTQALHTAQLVPGSRAAMKPGRKHPVWRCLLLSTCPPRPCLHPRPPSPGVYFFFYSALKERAVAWQRARAARAGAIGGGPGGGRGDNIGVVASLLVATAAGALNQLITMPASVVATRIQVGAREDLEDLGGDGGGRCCVALGWLDVVGKG